MPDHVVLATAILSAFHRPRYCGTARIAPRNLLPHLRYVQDVGVDKPDPAIFGRAFEQARFLQPDLQRHEVLHIGDSLAADFCGARAAGMQARRSAAFSA
jgi:FMN phosphatase YigB (HAD superfamily)